MVNLRRPWVTHPRIPASRSQCKGHSNAGRRCSGWLGRTKADSSCSGRVQSPERAVYQAPQWVASHKVNPTGEPCLTRPMLPGNGSSMASRVPRDREEQGCRWACGIGGGGGVPGRRLYVTTPTGSPSCRWPTHSD